MKSWSSSKQVPSAFHWVNNDGAHGPIDSLKSKVGSGLKTTPFVNTVSISGIPDNSRYMVGGRSLVAVKLHFLRCIWNNNPSMFNIGILLSLSCLLCISIVGIDIRLPKALLVLVNIGRFSRSVMVAPRFFIHLS